MPTLALVVLTSWSAATAALTPKPDDTQADIVTAIWNSVPDRHRFNDYESRLIMILGDHPPIRVELPAAASPAQLDRLEAACERIRRGERPGPGEYAIHFGRTPFEVVRPESRVEGARPAAAAVKTGEPVLFPMRAHPRWSPADCAVENLNQLAVVMRFLEGTSDEVHVEIFDAAIDPTQRAAVRRHFAIRAGDPLLGGRFDFHGRATRVRWTSAGLPTYVSESREYPFERAPTPAKAGAGADFVFTPRDGESLTMQARALVARLEAEGVLNGPGEIVLGDDLAVPKSDRSGLHLLVSGLMSQRNADQPLRARKLIVWRSQLGDECERRVLQ